LTRQIEASPNVLVVNYDNLNDATLAMKKTDVFALVVFPYHMKVNLLAQHQPTIDVRYNSQFLLVGKMLSSKIQASLGAGLKNLSTVKQLLHGVPKSQAIINLSPVSYQGTALFNQNSNYVAFLVPPILIAMLQLISALLFINGLTHEISNRTEKEWYKNGVWKGLFTKIIFYTSLMMLQGAFLYSFIYQIIGMPMNGEFRTLLFALLIMLLALWTIILFFFFLIKDATRVTSMSLALLSPSFGFMGVTFPTHDMPTIALYWRTIMPSSHYIDAHVKIVSYGERFYDLFLSLTTYWGYLLLMPIIFYLVNKGVTDADSYLEDKGE
ncbi:MAG TPA: ABC transporter permease, partial [Psychromonas hadalis]|nr:ABC transporter permease [Psychromonas hadalis]